MSLNQVPGDLMAHAPYLWALCYRMTGVAADADDLVQETFARALSHPPQQGEGALRPWLTRVALNAGKDLLRRRRREGYKGPWLPSPVPLQSDAAAEPPAHEPEVGNSSEERYSLLESASFAFLIALESLTPQQRAVLLLREVFDYSLAEVAECLGLTVANVKVIHHRARQKLKGYDARREWDRASVEARNQRALEQLMAALASRDLAALEALFTEDVVALTDGGAEFHAARVPVVGAQRVALLLSRLVELRDPPESVELRWLNGSPALVVTFAHGRPHEALRSVVRVDTAPDGRIRDFYTVLATRKLTATSSAAGHER